MFMVKFFAEDKSTKDRMNSSDVFYKNFENTEISVIHLQRQHFLSLMPNCRVLVLIEQKDIQHEKSN
jgi:hypothetical protein